MPQWPKPAEGSWTEHYPGLGTGRVVFDVTPEFYELERDAIFKRAWLNVGRVEQVARPGSYFTKELPMAKTSIIVVRDNDDEVRAFHNICRHRGNKLVWQDFPRRRPAARVGSSRASTTAGVTASTVRCTFVQQEDEFFDLDKADYGLVPVHCDVWAGFIFVNLDDTPRWSLREFLGPMVTALDGYPFDQMTERYEFRAEVDANWKIFLDAFQEYYHVPALHPQQVPAAVRKPDAAFESAHFQLDGPHRVTSSGGARRWTLAPEFMYPIEVALRSGLLGPWEVPDIGDSPGVNPGRVDPWGIDNFQIFPNLEILIYRGGTSPTGTGRPRTTRICSRGSCTSSPRPRCASAWSTRSPPSCSRSSRCRTRARSRARSRRSIPGCSASSRWATRSSSSGTSTRRCPTGSRSTSASDRVRV